jgi:hypothetical protein
VWLLRLRLCTWCAALVVMLTACARSRADSCACRRLACPESHRSALCGVQEPLSTAGGLWLYRRHTGDMHQQMCRAFVPSWFHTWMVDGLAGCTFCVDTLSFEAGLERLYRSALPVPTDGMLVWQRCSQLPLWLDEHPVGSRVPGVHSNFEACRVETAGCCSPCSAVFSDCHVVLRAWPVIAANLSRQL